LDPEEGIQAGINEQIRHVFTHVLLSSLLMSTHSCAASQLQRNYQRPTLKKSNKQNDWAARRLLPLGDMLFCPARQHSGTIASHDHFVSCAAYRHRHWFRSLLVRTYRLHRLSHSLVIITLLLESRTFSPTILSVMALESLEPRDHHCLLKNRAVPQLVMSCSLSQTLNSLNSCSLGKREIGSAAIA